MDTNIIKDGYFIGNIKELISKEQNSIILDKASLLKTSHQNKFKSDYRFDYVTNERKNNQRGEYFHEVDFDTKTELLQAKENRMHELRSNPDVDITQSFWEYPSCILSGENDEEEVYESRIKTGSTKKIISNICLEIVNNVYDNHTNFETNLGWLTLFEKEDLITPHRDGQNPGRVCAILLYLNDDWKEGDGGELVIIDKQNEKIKIPPTFGTTVVLDFTLEENNLSHAVLPIQGDFKRWAFIDFINTKKEDLL